MKALLQRVKNASVTINNKKIANTNRGLLVFLGFTHGDNQRDIDFLVDKISNLRIFEGENGKLDLSVTDIKGEILVVSQFTLYGECNAGRRPDFGAAAPIDEAKAIYQQAIASFKKTGLIVQEGQFQAHMMVELINDGPFTILLESNLHK